MMREAKMEDKKGSEKAQMLANERDRDGSPMH